MAEQDGRTEKATPKKRKESRQQGSVAKSKEMGNFFSLLSLGVVLMLFGEWFVDKILHFQLLVLQLVELRVEPLVFFKKLALEVLSVFLYMAFVIFIFQMINQMIQIGFLFSPKIIKPDPKKLNPANYFKNLFSARSFVEIIKALFVVIVLGFVVYSVLSDRVKEISGGMLLPWNDSLLLLWQVFKEIFMKILVALFFVGLLDFAFQRYDWEKKIRMKKQEVKDEHKNTEGNPETKRRQRQVAIQMLRNEVRTKVPESTVLITNPTHYSVAIYYKRGEGPPKVVAKGIDHIALYMREIAKEHDIPIYEAPPLARELYKKVGENEYIPQELYQAIIDILKVLIVAGKIKI